MGKTRQRSNFSSCNKRSFQAELGVTLIELLIVIVIIAILAFVAAPNMRDFLRRSAMDAAMVDLRSAISFARSEAIARGKPVTICHSSDQATCSTTEANKGNWHQGWIVFLDYGEDGVVNAGDKVSRIHEALATPYTLTFNAISGSTIGAATDFIQFGRTGRLTSAAGNPSQGLFKICEESGSDLFARGLVLSATGTIQNTRDTDGDGIQNWSDTSELNCE